MNIKTKNNFENWCKKKQEIEFDGKYARNIEVGTIWRYYEGLNIGNEESKDGSFMRLGVVLENKTGNGLILIGPMTSKFNKYFSKYLFLLKNWFNIGITKESWILLNQIKLIDRKRFVKRKTDKKLSIKLIQKLKSKISDLFFIKK